MEEDIDTKMCQSMRNVIDGYIIKYQPSEFVFDLSNVNFMDSSGIGLLMGRYNLVRMLDSTMIILNPSKSIKKILDITSISKYIKVEQGGGIDE